MEKEKIFLGDVMVNESVYLVVLGQYRAILVASVIGFQKIYDLYCCTVNKLVHSPPKVNPQEMMF